MLEHVLTVMLVTPSQRYEKKTGRSKSDLLTYCARVLLPHSSSFFALFGVVSFQGPHIELSRSKDKQAFERQRESESADWQRSAEVSGQVVRTVLLRVDISSLTATAGLVW